MEDDLEPKPTKNKYTNKPKVGKSIFVKVDLVNIDKSNDKSIEPHQSTDNSTIEKSTENLIPKNISLSKGKKVMVETIPQ